MFDTVIVEYPLPDAGSAEVRQWETNSFSWPAMENYLLTAKGFLMKERFHCEDRSDPTIPGLLGLAGSLTKIHEAGMRRASAAS
jgi:hypothetical protein